MRRVKISAHWGAMNQGIPVSFLCTEGRYMESSLAHESMSGVFPVSFEALTEDEKRQTAYFWWIKSCYRPD